MKSTRSTSLRTAVFLTAVALAAGCSNSPSDTAAADHDTQPDALRISYGDDADNYGFLHLPGGAGPHPVVVMVHGGGWLEDHDLSYFEPLSQSLADEGIAVWNIEYRRVEAPEDGRSRSPMPTTPPKHSRLLCRMRPLGASIWIGCTSPDIQQEGTLPPGSQDDTPSPRMPRARNHRSVR